MRKRRWQTDLGHWPSTNFEGVKENNAFNSERIPIERNPLRHSRITLLFERKKGKK